MISIRDLLSHAPWIPQRTVDEVAEVLEHIGRTNENLCAQINKIQPYAFNDVEDLLEIRLNISPDVVYRYKFNINTLERWARLDNPKAFGELIVKGYIGESLNDIKFGTKVWANVQRDIALGVYTTLHDVLVALRASIAYVADGAGFFITNGTKTMSLCSHSSLIRTCSSIKIPTIEDTDLGAILVQFRTSILYEEVAYYPGIASKDTLNLFRGYNGRLVHEIDHACVDRIQNHLKDILCSGNEEVYIYLIKWLAYVIQRPTKPGVAILMIGKPGIGKTMFWEWFLESILGMHNSFSVPNLSDIAAKFNAHIANRRFLLISEVKGASKHDHSNLKALITDKFVKLEYKGKDSIQIQSAHCLAMTSNHRDHHFIDDSDRRFCVIECKDKAPDQAYFQALAKALQDGRDSFYTWLFKMNIEGFIPSNYPMTSIKADIANANSNPVERYLDENPWEGWREAAIVYDGYKHWCQVNNIIPVIANRFKINANGCIEAKRFSAGMRYHLCKTGDYKSSTSSS